MIKLGDWNELTVNRFTDHGAYLDGGRVGEILMPNAYLERGVRVGDQVNVFVYLDQEERLVATTESPLARVGDFAWLRVAWVNEYGAFLDWGLMKDLFVPFREQKMRMEKDRYYLVYIYIDEDTRRIVGTAKVERWLQPAPAAEYHRGRQVELLVQQKTELGFKVIVDNAYSGLVYRDQVFEEPHAGDRLTGSVVNVRPDGKLDVSLQRLGKQRFQDFAEVLLEELQTAGGFLPYTDKSDSSEIAERFGVSKKTFKRAVGTLYKNRNIVLEEKGIRLSSM
jgi:predicted RNA-binding protein (virulence factor B family)